MHPRTKSKMKGIEIPKGVEVMAPLGFYDFNRLLTNCFCVLSDSGTAPEEALFYKVPCVSLRMTTERPETVEGGAHVVAGMELSQHRRGGRHGHAPGMGGALRSERKLCRLVGRDQLHPQPDHQLVLEHDPESGNRFSDKII